MEAIQNFRMKINNRDYPKQQKNIYWDLYGWYILSILRTSN